MITDREARRIACDWHGGGGTALYALCSTGAINTARADHDAAMEIRREIEWALGSGHGLRTINLSKLLSYVEGRGKRGPVEGWSKL